MHTSLLNRTTPYIEKPLLENNCSIPSLKPEEFHHPPDNVSYIKVGPEYGNKELYSLMKLFAGRLYKEFAGTKSMSDWVQIKVEKVAASTPGM